VTNATQAEGREFMASPRARRDFRGNPKSETRNKFQDRRVGSWIGRGRGRSRQDPPRTAFATGLAGSVPASPHSSGQTRVGCGREAGRPEPRAMGVVHGLRHRGYVPQKISPARAQVLQPLYLVGTKRAGALGIGVHPNVNLSRERRRVTGRSDPEGGQEPEERALLGQALASVEKTGAVYPGQHLFVTGLAFHTSPGFGKRGRG